MTDALRWLELLLTSGILVGAVKLFSTQLIALGKIVQRLDDHETKDDERNEDMKNLITALAERMARIEGVLMTMRIAAGGGHNN